ncbi:hypothetical protein Asch01_01853 [Acinetobacter schindleri]|uniref:hypothetical protein n=1 Tax=Acinetobacter schindleri TaxID=108981 RepID=UPI0030A0CE6F
MLKLVSNKNGVEIHTLQIENGVATIEPAFEGIQELLQGLTDKQQILNALSGFDSEYVWAVTYETPPVPALTRRQFRLALVMNGFALADIEAVINSIEDAAQRQITLIEWQDGTTFIRTSPNLLFMAGLMGLSTEQVDALWTQALAL